MKIKVISITKDNIVYFDISVHSIHLDYIDTEFCYGGFIRVFDGYVSVYGASGNGGRGWKIIYRFSQ